MEILHVVEDTFAVSHKNRKYFHQSSPSHPKITIFQADDSCVGFTPTVYIYNRRQSRYFRTSYLSLLGIIFSETKTRFDFLG